MWWAMEQGHRDWPMKKYFGGMVSRLGDPHMENLGRLVKGIAHRGE